MAISFRNIPPNLRVPLAYFEMSNERAATFQIIQNALLLGSTPAGGALEPNRATLCTSADQASALGGVGSAFHRQAIAWFRNNASVPLYLLAALEPTGVGAYTHSWGAIEWSGTATGGGTIPLYIGGRAIRINVSVGDTADDIAAATRDAINTNPQCGVDAFIDAAAPGPAPPPALPDGTDVTQLRARQAGTLGGLDVGFGYAGTVGGEIMPGGITGTITRMTGGAGRPDLGVLLASIGDAAFDFVMDPYEVDGALGAQDLDDLDEFMNDTSGRWSWAQQLYGHYFAAYETRVGGLSALGRTRNGQHGTIFGFFGSPTPHDEWLAAYVGQAAGSLIIDPARPVQALPLIGVRAPPTEDRFTILERQVLYFDGISSYYTTEDGTAYIDRLITSYRVNVWGAPDNSYLDVETMFTAMYYSRFMRQRILTKFPRHKLASDGVRFGVGQAIVTPRIMRAEFVAAYSELVEVGIVENIEGFERDIIVERDQNDPNRLNVLAPPDWVNQLRIAAVLVAFRLQDVSASGRVA
jgi:phage tail sheath gpL-like